MGDEGRQSRSDTTRRFGLREQPERGTSKSQGKQKLGEDRGVSWRKEA